MKEWSVWHGQDGWSLVITEHPWWTTAFCWAAETVDGLTGHLWCSGRPNWLWKVPLGKPQYYEDGDPEDPMLSNSVQGLLYDIFNAAVTADWKFGKELMTIPITEEQAVALGTKIEEYTYLKD